MTWSKGKYISWYLYVTRKWLLSILSYTTNNLGRYESFDTLRPKQNGRHFANDFFKWIFYASAFRRRRHYVFELSVRPSVRPKPEVPSFHLYMSPLVHPTNRDRFAACPSVRPERFTGICRRTHGGNGPTFCLLMYHGHLENWLDYGHGLLIFLIFGTILT